MTYGARLIRDSVSPSSSCSRNGNRFFIRVTDGARARWDDVRRSVTLLAEWELFVNAENVLL